MQLPDYVSPLDIPQVDAEMQSANCQEFTIGQKMQFAAGYFC